MRAVSVMRGVDPRGYTVVVGGGAGGAHAAKIAQELGVSKAICPTVAGGLCAFGMLAADVGHAYLTTWPMNTGDMDINAVNAIYDEMEAQADTELEAQGFASENIKTTRFADAKYPLPDARDHRVDPRTVRSERTTSSAWPTPSTMPTNASTLIACAICRST